MANETAIRDENHIPVLLAITNDANLETRMVRVDPATNRVLVSAGGGGIGTVTSISAGTGITFTPNPITTTGTVALTIPVVVSSGGTGTTTQFTQGSVVFAGALGVYSQNNTDFNWTNSTKTLHVNMMNFGDSNNTTFQSDGQIIMGSYLQALYICATSANGSFTIRERNNGTINGTFTTSDVVGGGSSVFSWLGTMLYKVSVSPQATTPIAVATTDSAKVFTNEGATAKIVFNLPTAVANLMYTFVVEDSDGIDIVANSGDTIRFAGTVTAAAGTITSTTIGSTITLVAINATEWIATSLMGTWA